MDINFEHCLAFVLKEEGGNDDDPNDHGGRTSRGITQREWDAYCVQHQHPTPSDVWQAPDADIKVIYHDSYWMPHAPNLPNGLDLCFFDFAVNAGPRQAIKTLQKALGITSDGLWGPQTEETVKALTLNQTVTFTSGNTPLMHAINAFCNFREDFYKGLSQYPRYGKGWTSRNEACRKEALSMAGANVPSPQANPLDTKVNTTHGPASAVVIVAGGTAVAAHYQSPLIFLGILGVAVVVGLIVHYFANRKIT